MKYIITVIAAAFLGTTAIANDPYGNNEQMMQLMQYVQELQAENAELKAKIAAVKHYPQDTRTVADGYIKAGIANENAAGEVSMNYNAQVYMNGNYITQVATPNGYLEKHQVQSIITAAEKIAEEAYKKGYTAGHNKGWQSSLETLEYELTQ